MSTISIKYLDKLNNIKNRYSIPYTKKNMKEEHYVELMYEELSIEMIKEIERLNNIINKGIEYILGNDLDNFDNINNLLNILKGSDKK